ncbi:hypothetical protein D3C75_1028900 [compost metagenome]
MTTFELPPQFTINRQQRVILNAEQAFAINAQLVLIKQLTGKNVSVNRFMKAAALQKALRILDEEEE